MRLVVIGGGVVGRRRARIAHSAGDRVVAVCDTIATRACEVAREVDAKAVTDWRATVRDEDVDAVVVATTHRWLTDVSAAALAHGQHVLCEKPGGIDPAAVDANVRAARAAGLVYQIGYTHRFHRHIQALEEAIRSEALGRIHFVRAVMGNGARPGFETEWRADRAAAGGGVLMDLGVHLLDLSAALTGPLALAGASLSGTHWSNPNELGVEDNAMLTLHGHDGAVVGLHASWTQWSNLFSLEVSGERGALQARGLRGTTYGETVLVHHGLSDGETRPAQSVGYFDAETPNSSWAAEWEHFTRLIDSASAHQANGRAAASTLRTVAGAYSLGGLGPGRGDLNQVPSLDERTDRPHRPQHPRHGW